MLIAMIVWLSIVKDMRLGAKFLQYFSFLLKYAVHPKVVPELESLGEGYKFHQNE